MAIKVKMRTNNDPHAMCNSCQANQRESLGMFDIRIGNIQVTVCDRCNGALFSKTLSASCLIDGRTKDKDDMRLINVRRNEEAKKWLNQMKSS